MERVICIGSSSKDIFFPTNKGIIYETPDDLTAQRKIAFELGAKYQVDQRFESLGGCAANVARGLSKLGISVGCCTKIGNDDSGDWIKNRLVSGGVKIEALQVEVGCKSDLSVIIVDEKTGESTIFSDRDANEKLEIIKEKLEGIEWLFISSLNGDWQKNLSNILEVAKKNGAKIAFNPGQKNISTDIASVLEFISHCDLLMVNKDEALEIVLGINEQFSREKLEDEVFLLKVLKNMGPRVVFITDGERGSWAIDDRDIFHADAMLVHALDTTGCGDAFASGFFGAMLNNENIQECLKWGVVNSRSCALHYGGQDGLLSADELVLLLANAQVEKIA